MSNVGRGVSIVVSRIRGWSTPRRLVAGLLLPLTVLPGGPASADESFHRIYGKPLIGDVEGHEVNADLHGLVITVFGKGTCSRNYYVLAATATMGAGRPLSLVSCEAQLCTDSELIKDCGRKVKLPKYRSVPCTGTLDIQESGLVLLDVNYTVEKWGVPDCKKTGDETLSKRIVLEEPAQNKEKPKDTKTLPSARDVINCAAKSYMIPLQLS